MKRFFTIAALSLLISCGPSSDPPPPAPPPPPPPAMETDSDADGVVDYMEVEIDEQPVIVTARRIERSGVTQEAVRSPEPVVRSTTIPFDDVVSQLSTASFAYSWPDRVNVEDTFDVSLGVNPSLTAQQVREEIGGSDAAMGQVRISRVLIARLTAPDFKVESITPERQAIDRSETTQWRWQLQPLSAGKDRKIKLTVVAVVEVGAEKAERFVKTFDGVITVDVTPQQQFKKLVQDHWQWGFSALLVPLGAMLWGWLRRKKKPAKADAE